MNDDRDAQDAARPATFGQDASGHEDDASPPQTSATRLDVRESPPRFVSRLTRQTLAVVMAGGRGQRLGPLTDWRAKPAMPFGGSFRIVDFTLSNCVNSGIRRMCVLTQYKAHSLIRHIQQGWGFMRGEFGEYVEIVPAQQRLGDTWYRGTADAVYQNLDIIRMHAPRYVIVLAGDHIYKMDYGRMLAHHVDTGAKVTVGCIEVPLSKAHAFGVMSIDPSTRIVAFDEKPADPTPLPGNPDVALASMGIYVFDTEYLLEHLKADAADAASSHDFGKDIIPALIDDAAFAYPFRDEATGAPIYWRDVGTIDAYWAANLELADVSPELNIYDRDWPIWTRLEQLPPAKFVFDDPGRRGMAVDSLVASGCILSGAYVNHSVLSYRTHLHSGTEVRDSVLLPDVELGVGSAVRRAVIDKGCRVPPGTRIGFDAESDAKRFHLTADGITLVTPSMLGQRIHDVS